MSGATWNGPTLVSLVDGRMVFSDAEAYRHECEARAILVMPFDVRREHLFDLERMRGPDAAAALHATMAELRAAGQGG